MKDSLSIMASGGRKRKKLDDNFAVPSNRVSNTNYYHPLQALNDNDKTDDDDMADTTPESIKSYIPPITIIKSTTAEIHEMCKLVKILQYSIRKISIGHKLFCELEKDYNSMTKYLKENKIEFFSYMSKNNRPYKVVLSGLEKMDPNKLKQDLINVNLQVLDVKPVFKKTEYNKEIILYIIYLKKGSITLKDLKEKYKSIDYIRVKWSYQSKQQHKITQCYNCQMYGHGSNHCNIKTFCAKCAGPHSTSACTSNDAKCANCNGQHPSNYSMCRSRSTYIELKKRYTKPQRISSQRHVFNPIPSCPVDGRSWSNVVYPRNSQTDNNLNSELFSLDELKSLTIELVNNLRNCKSKTDQFQVITSLAFKFLS